VDQLTPYTRRPSRPSATGTGPGLRLAPEWSGEPGLRVGDAERAAACDALAEHFAAGRLDPAELDDRLARAMAARSVDELRALFADLEPRRRVPTAVPTPAPVERGDSTGLVVVLTTVVVLSLLLAGGMLVALGAYNPAFFVAALVGGTATAVAGACGAVVAGRTLRRR
jgi:hypothetical protein